MRGAKANENRKRETERNGPAAAPAPAWQRRPRELGRERLWTWQNPWSALAGEREDLEAKPTESSLEAEITEDQSHMAREGGSGGSHRRPGKVGDCRTGRKVRWGSELLLRLCETRRDGDRLSGEASMRSSGISNGEEEEEKTTKK
ncbi:hypothetical protein CRG98_049743, partial [Punica granatum]